MATDRAGVELVGVEEVTLTPEEETLDAALAGCGLEDEEHRAEVLARLLDLPPSLRVSIDQRRGLFPAAVNPAAKKHFEHIKPDGDTLAQMLRLNSGVIDPEAKWRDLNRAEKAAANRMWDGFANGFDLSPLPKGKAANIDPAIVLYTAFTLREALGRKTLGYSTSPSDNRRGGPFLRAVAATLGAQLADELRQQQALGPIGMVGVQETPGVPAPETIRGMLMVANSKPFQAQARRLGLRLTSGAVVDDPAHFRLALALAERARKRRSARH